MITLDRDSGVPTGEQLVRQLRFEIASGRYQVGDRLPSTRTLASQLGISFHTVRKSYGKLVEIGLLEAIAGSGFVVVASSIGLTTDRLEEGAAVANDAIRRLMGLGLGEREVEALLMEQLGQLMESVSVPDLPGLETVLAYSSHL